MYRALHIETVLLDSISIVKFVSDVYLIFSAIILFLRASIKHLNIDSKFIYKENQVGVKDGIYVIEGENDSSVILKVGNSEINLKGDLGNTYVSF